MTKHAMVTFRLHRNGVILSAILALLFSVLIFAAGYVASNLRRTALAPRTAGAAKPVAPKAEPPAQQAAVNSWTIRLGVFGSEEEAKALAARMAKGKLETLLSSAETADGTKLYIVTSGHYAKRQEATVAAAKFDADYGLNTAIISVPPQ